MVGSSPSTNKWTSRLVFDSTCNDTLASEPGLVTTTFFDGFTYTVYLCFTPASTLLSLSTTRDTALPTNQEPARHNYVSNSKQVSGEPMARLRLGEEECRSLLELRVGDDISSDDYKGILELCSEYIRKAEKQSH